MTRYLAVLLFAFSAVALGSTGNLRKVNSSITVDANQLAGDVSTVNGSITVREDAQVRDVSTVNGSIRLYARAQAHDVETVNGSVLVAEDVLVSGGVEAVNGAMTLRRGARVDGDLENVNGEITLEAASVRGGIETTNGDVRIGTGSRVEGGIRFEKAGGWSWNPSQSLPRLTIEPGAVVSGALRFDREVELSVAGDAVVGPVEGVPPKRVP